MKIMICIVLLLSCTVLAIKDNIIYADDINGIEYALYQTLGGAYGSDKLYVRDGTTVGIGTGEQDRVGVAEIARDKAYRKYADRACWERYGVPYNSLPEGDRRRVEIDEETSDKRGGLLHSVMISDAFFPFRDGVEVGLREGITAVVQPGGSLNDHQVIQACDEFGATMVFTGQRSFKH